MLSRRALLLQLVLALTSACDATSTATPSHSRVRRDDLSRAGMIASHLDADGTARFLRAAGRHAVPPGTTIAQAAHIHAASFGLPSRAQRTLELVRVVDLHERGAIAIFRQRVSGLDVLGGELRVLMRSDGSLVALSGAPSPLAAPARAPRFAHSAAEAISAAIAGVDGALASDARARAVLADGGEALVPAWSVELAAVHGASREELRAVVRDSDLRVLERHSLTQADAFTYRVWADPDGEGRPRDGPFSDCTPHPTGVPDGMRPPFVAPALVSMEGFDSPAGGPADPWLPATATQSTGNNVDAYTDSFAPDGFSAGDVHATTTAPRTFDRTYDVARDPLADDEQRMAAVTQAFYTANWLHDWWYDSGFDEAAGNAQASNYGRGGEEGDAMHVEIQDRAPDLVNNSNMSTPADGRSPTMQIEVWVAPDRSMQVAPIGSHPPIGLAEFGPRAFDVAAPLVRVDDGIGVSDDGCEPPAGSLVGAIALVSRGMCGFKQKVVIAETAGAVGIVIANDIPFEGAPPLIADGPPAGPVTIPIVTLSMEDGAAIEAALATSALTVTLHRAPGLLREGGIDNTLVAHEWGHYLHQRLAQCSAPQCTAMSEGWGDFNALMMTVREGDRLDGTYGISGYSAIPSVDPIYFGIRRYPYSIDAAKNALSFRHIADGEPLPTGVLRTPTFFAANSEVHNAGEVWGVMLWEAYAALLAETQGPGATRTFAEARRAMSDYVVAGLMMTPPDATYTEARDAILAVAGADEPVLAEAFARRGAGSCAVSPDRGSSDFVGVVESFLVAPKISIGAVTLDDSIASCDGDGALEPGERGWLTIALANGGGAALAGTRVRATTSAMHVSFPQGASTTVASIDPFGATSVAFEVEIDPAFASASGLVIGVTVENADACAPIETRDFTAAIAANCTTMDAAVDAGAIDAGRPDASRMVVGTGCGCRIAGASRANEALYAPAMGCLLGLAARRIRRSTKLR